MKNANTEPTHDFQAEILHWLVVSLDAFGEALLRGDPHLDRWAGFYDTPIKVFGPPYDPKLWWEADHGVIGVAERQAFSRAAKTLEAAGLVVLIRQHGTRLSHLKPTAKGLQVALRLTPEADRVSIAKAVRTATWGTKQHLAAIKAAEAPAANA